MDVEMGDATSEKESTKFVEGWVVENLDSSAFRTKVYPPQLVGTSQQRA